MVLRGLLYQLTGDEEVAATRIEIDPTGFQTFMKVVDDDVPLLSQGSSTSTGSELPVPARRHGPEDAPDEPQPHPRREIDDEEFAFCLEELGLDPWVRELQWQPSAREPAPGFS